jgi:hypothetical protein
LVELADTSLSAAEYSECDVSKLVSSIRVRTNVELDDTGEARPSASGGRRGERAGEIARAETLS